MAIITKSDTAPDGDLTVSLAGVSYALTTDSPEFHTTDLAVIANARADLRLKVEEDTHELVDGLAPVLDPNDPHDVASSDHLSASASPAAVEAAALNQAAINAAIGVTPIPLEVVPTAADEQDFVYSQLGIKPVHPADIAVEPAPAEPAAPVSEGPTVTVTPTTPPSAPASVGVSS